ncbi:hypothetical protein BU15DRAFT_77476 [Melanogaster broomeanus]|nr:hypothetical protein BU15DRAFT_77476 [Melanogaster broomeanus]
MSMGRRARGDCADGHQRGAAPVEGPAKKSRVKKIDTLFTSLMTSLDLAVLEKFKEQDAQMHATDKLIQDTKYNRALWPRQRNHDNATQPRNAPHRRYGLDSTIVTTQRSQPSDDATQPHNAPARAL